MHLVVRASAEEPVEEPTSRVPERLFEGLTLTSAEAVKRNSEIVNTN
jgi:hypothetical protein